MNNQSEITGHANEDPIASAYLSSYQFQKEATTWVFNSMDRIATGQMLFELAQQMSSGGIDNKRHFRDCVKTIMLNLIGVDDAELVATTDPIHLADGNNSPIKALALDVGGKRTYIHDLGDGISACLTLLLPLLINSGEPGVIFIEEPELHLHPGLQRRLMKLMADPSIRANTKICLTTHSPFILDAVSEYIRESEVSFIRVTDSASGIHNVEYSPSFDLEILEDLGATAAALLARCLIWVEGPSDIRYLRALIGMQAPELVEGRDFVLVAYAGSLIDSWISDDHMPAPIAIPKIGYYSFVIADEDPDKSARHNRRRAVFEETLGKVTYHVADGGLEIENLLSEDVWHMILPLIAPVKWSIKKRPFPKNYARKRMESVADYSYGAIDRLPKGNGMTLETSRKVAASVAFLRLTASGEIKYDIVGERATVLAETVCRFIRDRIKQSAAP